MSIGEFWPSINLARLYHLNGNSIDYSGNGQNGADTNISYAAAYGKFGQGAAFNGSSSKINIRAITTLTGNFFIAFWISNVGQAPQAIFDNEVSGTTWPTVRVLVENSGGYKFKLSVWGGNTQNPNASVFTTSNVSTAKTFVVFTRDGSYINAYVNGAFENRTAWSTAQWAWSGEYYLGVLPAWSTYLGAYLDEFVIGNYSLAPEYIRKWYGFCRGMM